MIKELTRVREEVTSASDVESLSRSEIDSIGRDIILPLAEPIMDWLQEEAIEEIVMNRPGEVWVRRRKADEKGRLWVPYLEKTLDRERMSLIIHTLANVGNTPSFGPAGVPLCFGTLPGGHRYAAGIGPNFQYESGELSSEGTIIFCARQFTRDMDIRFEDYGLRQGAELKPLNAMLSRKLDTSDPLMRVMNSIRRGDHIIVSGAMGSGKTSLLNHIIGMLDRKYRIVTIEDTSELKVPHVNRMHILMNRMGQANQMTYAKVVDLITRMTPDVIMAGEVSTTNAVTIWEMMRAGHGHFMTTIHAETAAEAIDTFIQRMSREDKEGTSDRVTLAKQMREKIRVIQITKFPDGRREITEVV